MYQITHSGSRKTVEFTTDSIYIQNSAIGGLISIGIVDHTTRLYTFSHFGPPSSLSKYTSSFSQEHHVVQSGYLNLCISPEITTPHPVEVFSSSTLLDTPAPLIKPLGALVVDSIEDINLLLHENVSTPALGIPF